jgi:hypothetical protein
MQAQVHQINTSPTARGGIDFRRAEPTVHVKIKLRNLAYDLEHVGLVRADTADADGYVHAVVYKSTWENTIKQDIEEHPESILFAKRAYLNGLREFVVDRLKIDEKEVAGEVSSWPEKARMLERRYANSWEAEFYKIERRSARPLVEAKLVEDNLPMPLTHQERLNERDYQAG